MPTVWGQKEDARTIVLYLKYADALEAFMPSDRLRIRIEKDRNGKFNSLFHVMLDRCVKAMNRGPAETTIEDLKKWVKLKNGWYDIVTLPEPATGGQVEAIDYKSTNFSSMGEEEFGRFVQNTCQIIEQELAPWISDAPEWLEISEMLASISAPTPHNFENDPSTEKETR